MTIVLFLPAFSKTDKNNLISDTLERNVELKEVVVKPKRQKYSKKNNPAVDFVNKLRETSRNSDPANHENYSYKRYGRLTMALSPFDSEKMAKGKFSFLRNYTTLSPLSENVMLPFSVKEKSSSVYFSSNGKEQKEIIEAVNRNGLDEVLNQEQMEKVLEDILREIDLYQDDVNLMQNRFVSPLSKIGPDFYMYFLTDTVTNVDGSRWIELSFTPRVNTTFGFLGRLYVAEGDTTMFVRKIKLGFPHNINVNFIDNIAVEQTYERAPDGTRQKIVDDLQAEFKLLPGVPGVYARRMTRYDNYSFTSPDSSTMTVLNTIIGDDITLDTAEETGLNNDYWVQLRDDDMTEPEKNVKDMVSDLRKVRTYRYIEKAIQIFASGYIPTNSNFAKSKFDVGPVFNMISHNQLEGWRLMVGGMTTHNLSKHWFFDGLVAYGFKDKKWKETAAVEYSFIEKNNDPHAFPIQSIRADFFNDVDYLGQKLNTFGMIFQSIQRKSQNLIAYRRGGSLTYTHERENHLSWTIKGDFSRMESSDLMVFRRTDGSMFGHYNKYSATASVRWAPGEKMFESRIRRFSINKDNWTLGFSASVSRITTPWINYRKLNIEASIWKRFWLSAFGSIDIDIVGGKTWGTVPFTELSTMPVSTSYLIVAGAFQLANPMEFVGDFYGKWDLTYRGMGILFNRIPLINKLKIREIIGIRGWWSSLRDTNNPVYNNQLFLFPYDEMRTVMPRPYMELYAGLDNIFSVLRVDYVWRATYRDTPGCDKWGIRLSVHFSF